jgi:hypothetical protein
MDGGFRMLGAVLLVAAALIGLTASGGSAAGSDAAVAEVAKKKAKKCKKHGDRNRSRDAIAAKGKRKKKSCKKTDAPPAAPSPPTPAAPASLAISPTDHDFGLVLVSASKAFTTINVGGSPSGPMVAGLGGPEPDDLAISDDTCTGASLAVGASCTLTVTYTPGFDLATPPADGVLTVTAVPGGQASAGIRGARSP